MNAILVCQKWVASDDEARAASHSPADRAALEVALTLRDRSAPAAEVIVVSLGGPGARRGLRDSLARGADRALWINGPTDLRSDAVAAAIHAAVSSQLPEIATPTWVLCGDYSIDRGSGSVPAFLADLWNAEQALGLVQIAEPTATNHETTLAVTRRLDGGRRERLKVEAPAVLSVEGSIASLRRASLSRELAAAEMPILETQGPNAPREAPAEITRYRPRARMLTAPVGTSALERVRSITEPATAVAHGETVVLPPAEAADRILATLAEWGYLSPEDNARHNAR
jgi:electron transfer flavoprotein beta subunit